MAVVVSVAAVEDADRASPLLDGASSRPNAAYGLLLSDAPLSRTRNRRLTMDQPAAIAGGSNDLDDVYFLDLIDKLVRGGGGSVALPAGLGTMTIEKDE
jgi:hypothetical protein